MALPLGLSSPGHRKSKIDHRSAKWFSMDVPVRTRSEFLPAGFLLDSDHGSRPATHVFFR